MTDKIERNAQGKIIPKLFTLAQIKAMDSDMGGFCIACGAEAYNVEPDARHYRCEACELNRVYGAQEIAIMGLVTENDEEDEEDDFL